MNISAQRGRRVSTFGQQILPGPGCRRCCQHYAGFLILTLKDLLLFSVVIKITINPGDLDQELCARPQGDYPADAVSQQGIYHLS